MRNLSLFLLIGPAILCGASVPSIAADGSSGSNGSEQPNRLEITPAAVELVGPTARQQLLVTRYVDGKPADRTRAATYHVETPEVLRVTESGLVSVVANGDGRVMIETDGLRAEVAVTVRHAEKPLPVDFERDVQPILTRFGCNSGACHGKASGQNGFRLSLLGFDSEFDYAALTKEARGRRVFLPAPSESLLLQKPAGIVPHGGGRRLPADGEHYETLLRWIETGAPRRLPNAPALERIELTPTDRILAGGEQQQLIVTAIYSDGSRRDVTRLSSYQSNESAIVAVDETGLVTAGSITGDAALMARFMDHIAVCNVAVPLPGEVPPEFYAGLPRHNYIDGHIWDKLQRLGLKTSEPAPDHAFLRRVYIDIIGRIPSADEARAFLEDPSPDKRQRLVDDLLANPEYAEHWANKWADLLRPNPYRVGIKATLSLDTWIREGFRENKPWDEFTRELLTAQGSTFRNGAVTLFRDRREPDELTTIVSQLFLGIRLECAKCHHHPFEVWGQDDFYSFAAYFARLGRKGRGLSPPISGSEEILYVADKGQVTHPLTGEVMEPRPLFGEAPEIEEGEDPRVSLAAWITSDENPFFAQTMANRIWADLMGRGLVEPVDDLRATNPPANAELLKALGEDFRDSGYDIKHLIRRITSSYVYGLSSLPVERNVVDTRNYSRYYRQRLRAEVLLDSVTQITGIPEDFDATPPGTLAKEIWSHRVESIFLDAFGRPDENQDPPCERTPDTTLVQALHLMNSRNLHRKATSDEGLAARLAKSERPPAEIVTEIYLSVYSRFPTDEEIALTTGLFEKEGADRRRVTEDILWALMNTPEFVFKN